MFPQKLPESIVTDPKRSSEVRVFELLKRNLSNEFTVFYSVAYQLKEKSEYAYDGEADFVVAHPQLGLLVLELKGGRIRYDSSESQWYTEDRHNVEHSIKDPFAQARRNHYSLRRKLQEAPLTSKYKYPSGYAVCFPDIQVPAHDIGLDAPRSIVLDSDDIQKPEQRIYAIYNHWLSPKHKRGNDIDAINALADLIGRSWNFKSPLRDSVLADIRQTDEYTEQQFILLDHLQRFRKVLIGGCAGSGKTFLAAEKARRLRQEGFSVLFLCWNENLGRWLQKRLQDLDIEVNYLNQFLRWFVLQARKKGVSIPDRQVPTSEDLSLALSVGVSPYDAIIIDEGQDFTDYHWDLITKLLREDGILYIFYDDNQRIYSAKPISFPIETPPIVLTVNCRNAREIHELASVFYHSDHITTCFLKTGRQPELINCHDDEKGTLAKVLDRLVNQEGIESKDIVVLTPSFKDSLWENGLVVGEFQIARSLFQQTPSKNMIQTTSIAKFKGLERGVVILTELHQLDRNTNLDHLMYIGISRARSHLIVLARNQVDLDILNMASGKQTHGPTQAAPNPVLHPKRFARG